jgi:hypothetical protein
MTQHPPGDFQFAHFGNHVGRLIRVLQFFNGDARARDLVQPVAALDEVFEARADAGRDFEVGQ